MIPEIRPLFNRLTRSPFSWRPGVLFPLAALWCMELSPSRPSWTPWLQALLGALAFGFGEGVFDPPSQRRSARFSFLQAALPGAASLLAFQFSLLGTFLEAFGRLPEELSDPRGGPVLFYAAAATLVAARTLAPASWALGAIALASLAIDIGSPRAGIAWAVSAATAILAAISVESAWILEKLREQNISSLRALATWREGHLDFEDAASVDWVLFERGGVFTAGKPRVERIVPLDEGAGELDVLETAAMAEYALRNNIRDAIVSAYRSGRRTVSKILPAEYLQGRGARRIAGNGEATLVGNLRLFRDASWDADRLRFMEGKVRELSPSGQTVLFVARGEMLIGAIVLFDPPREETREYIAELRRLGVATAIESGDAGISVHAWSKEFPFDEVHAECDPAIRRALLETRRSEGRRVAVAGKYLTPHRARSEGAGIRLEWMRPRRGQGKSGREKRFEPVSQVFLKEKSPKGVLLFLGACKRARRLEIRARATIASYHAIALPIVSGAALGWAGNVSFPCFAAVLGAAVPWALGLRLGIHASPFGETRPLRTPPSASAPEHPALPGTEIASSCGSYGPGRPPAGLKDCDQERRLGVRS